jgi:hypothetical protein
MKTSLLVLLAGGLALAGCATHPNQPLAERGWIGGDYSLARPSGFRNFAADDGVENVSAQSLPPGQKAAILLTHLGTNTPAALAGLQERDLITELDHHPVTRLQRFRRVIDQAAPGTPLPVKIYRQNQFMDFTVTVGREKYRSGGSFTLFFPTVVHHWDLWPNPGFSLVLAGYEPNPGLRHDLSANVHEVYDEEWSVFLGFVEANQGSRVQAQERVQNGTPPASPQP